MKKIMLLGAAFLVSFAAFAQFSGGDGSAENPYVIRTNADLKLLAEYVNSKGDVKTQVNWSKGKHFIIQADSLVAEVAIGKGGNAGFSLDDGVKLKLTAERYCTGERIPEWVKYKYYTVMQVGTKRFPTGILLREIYSWVESDVLLNEAFTFQGSLDGNGNTVFVNVASGDTTQLFVDSNGEVKNLHLLPYSQKTVAKVTEKPKPIEVKPQPKQLPEDSVLEEKYRPTHHTPDEEGGGNVIYVEKPKEQNVDSIATVMAEEAEYVKGHHQFAIGVRGGMASFLHNFGTQDGKWELGYTGMLDLQYAYYFGKKTPKKPSWGIRTGLGIGYASSSAYVAVDDRFELNDAKGDLIKYHVTADPVRERDARVQMEIAVMPSFTYNGLFVNVGPKFMFPLYGHYRQKITNPSIEAYYEKYGVTVKDEVITGVLTEEHQVTKGKWQGAKFDVTVGAEIGYEWALQNGNGLALGVYADYAVYSGYSNPSTAGSLIQLTQPGLSAEAPQANVTVLSLSQKTAKLGYFDYGLKLTYHFNFYQK